VIESLAAFFTDPLFWSGLVQIIIIDILLSGDNAVVIALAVRSLPPAQQKKGIIFGAAAAIGLRVLFATVITYLMQVPFLKVAGGLMLFWIAVKLLMPDDEGEGSDIDPARNLLQAIKTIVIADAVMSLDNVIGIAAAAKGNVVLLVLGLLISIPLIIYGSTLILKLLDRFPIIVIAGGGLLGWIGGEIIVTDPAIVGWVDAHAHWLHWAGPIAGVALVVILGTWLGRRKQARQKAWRVAVNLAPEDRS
jgi:YjbE family integral membrane protein